MILRGIVLCGLAGLITVFGLAYWASAHRASDRIETVELFQRLSSGPTFGLRETAPITADFAADIACQVDPLARYMALSLSTAELYVAALPLGDTSVESVDHAVTTGEQIARSLLACNPTSGEAWFRLTMLTVFAEGWSADAIDLLAQSQTYAPFEDDLVRRRVQTISVPAGLPSELSGRLEGLIARDRAVVEPAS